MQTCVKTDMQKVELLDLPIPEPGPGEIVVKTSMATMTPSNPFSTPMGIWIGTGLAFSRVRMLSTAASKSAPVRSSLFTKARRGTL